VAAGEKLCFTQQQVRSSGCALECRIYAEDPDNDFFPSTGTITGLHHPKGPWIRNDSSLYPGMEVTVYYDPLLSKLLVWGRNRQELLDRVAWALEEYRIAGIKTTVDFCAHVLADPDFRSGRYHTGIIPQMQRHQQVPAVKDLKIVALAAALAAWQGQKNGRSGTLSGGPEKTGDPWTMAGRRYRLFGGAWER
jgi:acetyl/propionyl-CoA carboxylase alpha subunit